MFEGLDRSFPKDYKPDHFTTNHSGKFQVLSHILAQIHREGERVVLVSNYTQVKIVSNHYALGDCFKTTMIFVILPSITMLHHFACL